MTGRFLFWFMLLATVLVMTCTPSYKPPPPCGYNQMNPGDVFPLADHPNAYRTWIAEPTVNDWYTPEWAWYCEMHKTTHRAYLGWGDTIRYLQSW